MELFRKIRSWAEDWRMWRMWPFRHIRKALYWLRTHTYNRYHMLDMRSKVNGYAWGYSDVSELVLFANMALLCRFIEKGKAFEGYVDWRSAAEIRAAGVNIEPSEDDNRNGHATAKKEMLTIYEWWTKGRAEEHKKEDELLEAAYSDPFKFEPVPGSTLLRLNMGTTPEIRKLRDQCMAMEEALEKKDEEMLIRLIKVRGYMWT